MADRTIFVCQECGSSVLKWSGKCGECDSWGTLVEEVVSKADSSGRKNADVLQPQALDAVEVSESGPRMDTGSSEINQVLGGGIVPGSISLLAGEPGIGKSTLLLQIAADIAKNNDVLYVSGEESLQQIKMRAQRLGVTADRLSLLSATDTDSLAATIHEGNFAFVVVDSIQTMNTGKLNSNPGTVSQITTSAHILQETAKNTDVAVLIVGHVTKEGNIAGPKVLEHLVDTVLHLEGERFGSFKLLRSIKNRFGSTNEVGVFEMQEQGLMTVENPSARFLKERQPSPGSAVFAAMEGTRALLVEVQALVSDSPFGYPKRTSVGFDNNRLNVLIAVLNQHGGVDLADKDVYVNVVGGMKLQEPAADLVVALAIASSARRQPVDSTLAVFGEIGLSGEVRSISHVEARIKEAKRLRFRAAIGPDSENSFVHSSTTVRQAIDSAFT